MTNKPMLSVERELLERILDSIGFGEREELKAILKRPAVAGANADGLVPDDLVALLRADLRQEVEAARLSLAAQHQGQPIYQVMYRGDGGGGWRDAEKASYDAKVPHPKHWLTRIVYAEQPEPAADHTQCEECKGWGYHENHYEGGGTECGECGGSGNSMVAVALDTSALLGLLVSEISVDDRGFYHLSGIHPNNFKRALEESGAKITSEVKSHKSPVAVVMPERMDPRDPYDSEANQWNACLDEVARLNGVKP